MLMVGQGIEVCNRLSAAGQTRTADHLVNSQVLYLLSYGGFFMDGSKNQAFFLR